MLRQIAPLIPGFLLVTACTLQSQPAAVTSQQADGIDAVCTNTMGLEKGEFQFLACRKSLNTLVADLLQREGSLHAIDYCRRKGASADNVAACLPDDLKVGRSYYVVNHTVQLQREKVSCAQLGLAPGSAIFKRCVTRLDLDLDSNLH